MPTRLSGKWVVAAAVVVGLTLPVGAYAAGSKIEITGPGTNGRAAQVGVASQLYTAETSPQLYVRGVGFSQGQCNEVLRPPAGKAVVLKTARYNVFANSSPGLGNWVSLYVGTGCTSLVDSHNPAQIGSSEARFEPGVVVPDGQALWVKTSGNVQSELYAFGYVVPKGAAPSAASAPAQSGGDSALPPQESLD